MSWETYRQAGLMARVVGRLRAEILAEYIESWKTRDGISLALEISECTGLPVSSARRWLHAAGAGSGDIPLGVRLCPQRTTKAHLLSLVHVRNHQRENAWFFCHPWLRPDPDGVVPGRVA